MKYLGEGSLSSVLSVLFRVAWYLIIVFLVIAGAAALFLLASKTLLDPVALGLDAECWQAFLNFPIWALSLMTAYIAVFSILILQIIKLAQRLFTNFKNNVVFEQSNVLIISKIGKLMIWIAIVTFSLSTLFVSILLLMLCEIFKSGTALQDEQNLTI